MARVVEGLKSEALRIALQEALAGKSARLEELLSRHGGLPGPKPNLKLAAAFGVEIASTSDVDVRPLLRKLSAEDAAPNDARAFLPVAAAHGYAACLRRGVHERDGWVALEELAADERGPVRVGTLDALAGYAAREGVSDAFVNQVASWLDTEDRSLAFGAAALAVEVLAQPKVLATVREPEALFSYLSAVIDKISSAPRAAERLDARRRALMSLSQALPVVIATLRSGDRGAEWFRIESERADHPDVRQVLSECIVKLGAQALGSTVVDELRKSLESSAKPLRDPTLVRPGTGRGKRSRRTR